MSSVRLLWLALGSLTLGCTPPPRRANPVRPPLAFLHVPIGLCEDYPEESRSLAGARHDFQVLREMGLHTLRVSLGWDGIEPERGRYDFAFWDEFVKLSEEYEVTLVPYVAYTPEWNSSGTPADFWRVPPRDLGAFGELMALLAQRYRGRIHSWELWNEPDNPQYWLAGAGEYAALAQRGAEALRAIDPELQMVSGGLAGHIDFLSELFDRFDAGRWLDVVNLHSYYETWNPEPLETIPSYVDEAAQIIRRHGGRQAVWMAELGYGNYRAGARVSESTTARFAHEHTLEYQAVALVRSLSLLLSTAEVSLIAWYELKDPPSTDAVIGDANNRHLGLLFADYRPKPARFALSLMARLFADGFRPETLGLRFEPPKSAYAGERRVQVFTTPRPSLIVIGWLSSPAVPPISGNGEAIDERREQLRLRVPYEAGGAAQAFDARGQLRSPPTVTSRAGETELSLELRGDDVEIAELPLRLTSIGVAQNGAH